MRRGTVKAMAVVLSSAAAVGLSGMVHAQNMPVSVFLAKADALEAKGMLAMMSSDVGVVRGEMKATGMAYRAMINADKAAKRPPHSCPPPKVTMSADDIMAQFRKVPVAARPSTTIKTAFFAIMKRQYPCPG